VKIISLGDRRAVSIIKKKPISDKLYRLSDFTYPFSDHKVYLLHNTLTGMTVALSEAEWTLLKQADNDLLTGSKLLETGLEALVQNGFLVERDAKDYELYKQVVSLLKLMSGEKPGTKTYTILPTTGCNARCTYCYEEGMPVYSMNEETTDRVVDFIEKTRWQDKITLIWFGGEPLAGSRIIARICGKLTEKSIPFRSKIITNATMMTQELLEEAVTLWHLESVQVSVDGERQDYETRKRYVHPEEHHYDAMMNAVARMLDKGIKVRLRCNYDGKNLDGLKRFFDDVTAHFGCPENLSVYPAMLFQAQAEENADELYLRIQETNNYLRKLGLRDKKTKPFKLKTNYCEADSGDKSVVIAPDGKLYHCEHLPGNTAFGSVYDRQVTITSDKRADLPVDERCKSCCFLPECTPFFKNACPDYFKQCYAFKRIESEEMLRRLIRARA